MAQRVTGKKPFWTTGKIVGLGLALILVIGISGYAILNYNNGKAASTSRSADSCTNGATNYPACNSNTCQYGGVFPSCNPAPSCQYGGTYRNCNAANLECKGTAGCFTDTVS